MAKLTVETLEWVKAGIADRNGPIPHYATSYAWEAFAFGQHLARSCAAEPLSDLETRRGSVWVDPTNRAWKISFSPKCGAMINEVRA